MGHGSSKSRLSWHPVERGRAMDNLIVAMFNDSGMSIQEFANRAELKYSTAHDIVKGKTNVDNIGAGAFVRIAHALGTTADALAGCSVTYSVVSFDSDEKAELNGIYDSLSPEGKKQLMTFARGCAATYPKNNEAVGA